MTMGALLTMLALAAPGPRPQLPAPPAVEPAVFKHSDVIFMYAADDAAYKAYGATFVAWGGANTGPEVKRHRDLGIRCTGSMWCLTAGAKNLHDSAELREAVARDIEGRPVEVPWLFDHTYQGQKTWFGCTNHPAFREHCRREVRRVMAGGADGLHVDDHLGVAQAATAFGGGLCDCCIAAFREWLKTNAAPGELAAAGAADLATFDYRDLVRRHAATRAEYLKVRGRIPLKDHFDRFHLAAAADFVAELGRVAAEAAGHPVLLSANAWVGDKRHTVVAPHLTHVVCETPFSAGRGAADVARALAAFDAARALGKPLAVTGGGGDWAFVKANQAEDLVRFWIALAYAHGQWFMAPHPKRQWCFTKELGTHWYEAPADAYAPMYQFIRKNAEWFDGFDAADGLKAEIVNREPPAGNAAAGPVLTVRRKGPAGPVVIHVVNRDYDASARRMRPGRGVRLRLPVPLPAGMAGRTRLLAYDAEPLAAQVRTEGGAAQITVPELRIWTLVVIE